MTVYETMIPVYAYLIAAGAYALTAEDNPKSLPVIPVEYVPYVAKYMAEKAAKTATQA